jgi:hypothetical protein
MRYYILFEDDAQTKVSRAECLALAEKSDSPYQQRWFVDEESGLVIRLPRTAKGDKLARDNMRDIWREAKYQERWGGRTIKPTVDDEGDEVLFEPVDTSEKADVVGIAEEKALLDTLHAALAALTQEDADLIRAIFWDGKTERQLAPELGLKEPKSVNKRKHRVLEILRNNEALRAFFK